MVSSGAMRCAWCRRPLEDVHGHGACLNGGCPMFGLNQAECCSGETAEDGWVATSDVAAGPGGTVCGTPNAPVAAEDDASPADDDTVGGGD
jgi:hypothetical protein